MTEVRLSDEDSLERALKLFKRKLQKSGLFGELRRRQALRQTQRGARHQDRRGASPEAEKEGHRRLLVVQGSVGPQVILLTLALAASLDSAVVRQIQVAPAKSSARPSPAQASRSS